MKLLKILTEESEFDRDWKEYNALYPYGTPDAPEFDDWREDKAIEGVIKVVIPKAAKLNFTAFVNSFNRDMKSNGVLKDLIDDYNGDLTLINTFIAKRFSAKLAMNLGLNLTDIEHKNESRNSANLFQLISYAELTLVATFVYVDDKHRVVSDRTDVEIADSRSGDKYLETLFKFGK